MSSNSDRSSFNNQINRYRPWYLIVIILLFIWFWFCLPSSLFDKPVSTVIESSDGQLLGAKIAADEQWRFPPSPNVPNKFEKSIIAFEDKRFYSHFGIDLLAIGRAIRQNFKEGHIVSGGSTISMQVIRLSRGNQERTLLQKLIEAILTLRMELKYSKKEIISMYASNAPFGGNVIGIDAASWRYFGKKADQLSWSESAALAILPNSPSLIHPGKNRTILKAKRNRLLKKLLNIGLIDTLTFELATEEPLPEKPFPIPQIAPHLVQYLSKKRNDRKLLRTTIDFDIQNTANRVAFQNNSVLKNNEIHNISILVIDVENNKVLAYVGNEKSSGFHHGQAVDVIQAPRSSGSILKPLLYAMMQQEGFILPKSIIPDIPTYFKGFRPENYSKTYEGVVHADKALSRSLNIPFVRMLQEYGVEKFHFNLKKLGLSTLHFEPNHYGLSLILGGAETTLWDLTNIYAAMARRLNAFYKNNGQYDEEDFSKASFITIKENPRVDKNLSNQTAFLRYDAIWLAFEAMKELERPDNNGDWQRFANHQDIAWKTGTSFGFRDAWAIGVSPKFCVGIWVGNADGEGRPGITGINAAAPVLFEMLDYLPKSRWFDQPFDSMKKLATCSKSGYLAREGCPVDSSWSAANGENVSACNYHKTIYLDKSKKWQVNKSCESNFELTAESWFVLPAVEAYYYKPRNPDYYPLPEIHPECSAYDGTEIGMIQLIYPPPNAKIFIPVELGGQEGMTIFEAVHKKANSTLYWHIDEEFLGVTSEIHSIELNPSIGRHYLTVHDENGNMIRRTFEIISDEN